MLTRRLLKQTGYLLLGCSLLATATQAQVDTLFRFNADQRILKLWQSAPFYPVGYPPYPSYTDSTALYAQYDKLASFAQAQRDDRLLWYARLHKLLLRNGFRDHAEGRSTLLQDAQPTFEACPVPVVRAAYWYFRGRFAFGKSQFDDSFRGLFQAQQAFEQIGYAHIPEIGEYLYGLGNSYYFFGEDANCLTYLKAALRYPALSRRTRLATFNTMGTAYRQLRQYPQARACFARTRQLAQIWGDSAYLAIATGNLGQLLLVNKRHRQALPYLYEAYELSQISVPENAALTAVYLARALLALDSTAKAKSYLEHSTQFPKNMPWSYYGLAYMQTTAQYLKQTGQFRLASAYQDSVLQIKDTLRVRFDLHLLTASQAKVNAERSLRALSSLEAEKTAAVQTRNLILGTLVLLTLMGGYALRQNQQKRRQEKRVMLMRQHQAEALLAQYMTNLEEKNQLLEAISAELVRTRDSVEDSITDPAPPGSPDEAAMERLLNRVILTEVDWQQFKALFEGVHPAFFASLHRQLPDLTPAEIRLLALVKLRISSKQMAFMLGVNAESVRKSRYRLRGKLNLRQTDTSLDQLLQDL